MGKATIRAAVLVLAWSSSGCGGPEAATSSVPRLEATLGTVFAAGEEEAALSVIWDVDVSSDGHVFASDPQGAQVVVFGPDGAYARTIGRRGQGPGEFQAPANMSWRGDTLVVFDFRTGGNLFSQEGEYLGVVSFKRQTADNPWFGAMPIFLLADGNVMGFAPVPNSAVLEGMRTHQPWLSLTREGELVDTLALQSLVGQDVEIDLGGRPIAPPHPFASHPLVAMPPDASFMVMVDRHPPSGDGSPVIRVHRIALDGDTTLSQDVPYEPLEVTDVEIDSIARSIGAPRAAGLGLTEDRAAALVREQVAWPEYRPPVSGALTASDGTVWLRRERVTGDSIRWDVVDLRQRLGYALLPAAFDSKVMVAAGHDGARSGWDVYGVVLDDFDVPSVVRYRVSAGG